jgi:hypothetical protein
MALTPAEKMRAYRKRKQEAGLKQLNIWVNAGDAAPPESTGSHRDQWKEELKHEQLTAARKEGRRLARLQDNSSANGYTAGICAAAAYFIGMERTDIAQYLLTHFMITREISEAALQTDKRTKNLTLERLDKAGAWNKPPPILR